MQIVHTKYYGDLSVIRTWINGEFAGISLLADGRYVHHTGIELRDEDEPLLDKIIPPGHELQQAKAWFKNRHVIKATTPTARAIYQHPDGTWRYVDTHDLVRNLQDIYAATPRGIIRDAALEWLERFQQTEHRLPEPLPPQPLAQQILQLCADGKEYTVTELAKCLGKRQEELYASDLIKQLVARGQLERVAGTKGYGTRYRAPQAKPVPPGTPGKPRASDEDDDDAPTT